MTNGDKSRVQSIANNCNKLSTPSSPVIFHNLFIINVQLRSHVVKNFQARKHAWKMWSESDGPQAVDSLLPFVRVRDTLEHNALIISRARNKDRDGVSCGLWANNVIRRCSRPPRSCWRRSRFECVWWCASDRAGYGHKQLRGSGLAPRDASVIKRQA